MKGNKHVLKRNSSHIPIFKQTKEHHDIFFCNHDFSALSSFHRSNQNRMFSRGACNVSQMESHGNYAQNADEMFQDLAYLEAPPVGIYNKYHNSTAWSTKGLSTCHLPMTMEYN